MKVVGNTKDGVNVVDGVFKMFDSTGLPLDVIFDQCKQRNLLPSWIHLYHDAINQGWQDKTIFNRLETNISDVWGREYYHEVKLRLDLYVDRLNLTK